MTIITTHVHQVVTWTHSVGPSRWWTNPSWVQAVLSGAAILASGALGVIVPWNERRIQRRQERDARVQVNCSQWHVPKMLKVEVAYEPQLRHSGLTLSSRLIRPSDAVLLSGRRKAAYAGSLQDVPIVVPEVAHPLPLKQVTVAMNSLEFDQDGCLRGIFFVTSSGNQPEPERALVEFEIRTTATDRPVASWHGWVSAWSQ
jgi:hypothetical protein